MNTTTQTSNLSNTERGSRLVLTAVMIGAVLAAPATTPTWLAIVALYPAFTALIAIEPVYHLVGKFAASTRNAVQASSRGNALINGTR